MSYIMHQNAFDNWTGDYISGVMHLWIRQGLRDYSQTVHMFYNYTYHMLINGNVDYLICSDGYAPLT